MSAVEPLLVSVDESKRFIKDCMLAVGTRNYAASTLADLLVEADCRGHFSHGMNRLEFYINDVKRGLVDGNAQPEILKESPATAWVDGKRGLGAVVGNFCMDLAIRKAKAVGIGWVVAKGSSHFGIAGMYSVQAMKEGLIGVSFTNTSPIVAPTRGKKEFFGTNPLSVAAAATNGDSFVLDMATSVVAFGKVEINLRKEQPIPLNWCQNSSGQSITDPKEAFNSGILLPLGGQEEQSGYKGMGLAMMVELFCGILAGSNYGPNIPRWGSTSEEANLGQCFLAIDPGCFAPGFEERLKHLMDTMRNLEPMDPNKPVIVPGDRIKNHAKKVEKEGGIRYLQNQLDTCAKLAKELGIKPLTFLQQ